MFKDKLRMLRENANLTQKELGEKIFASRSAVSKWELGNGIPSDINIDALCKLFSVTEEWLLDREDLKCIAKKMENLLNQKEKDYILEYYSEFNNEECGKWNTSLKSKWYDYKITEYFEENFALKDALKKLSKREKQILLMRYYLGKTQMEVSNEVGISQAQVSRLEKNAIDSIKKHVCI